jgi:hypothetical protein
MKSTGARSIGAGPTATSPNARGCPPLSTSPSMKGTLAQIFSIPDLALERRLMTVERVDGLREAEILAARVSLSRTYAHHRAIHCAPSWMPEKMYASLVTGIVVECSWAECETVVYV